MIGINFDITKCFYSIEILGVSKCDCELECKIPLGLDVIIISEKGQTSAVCAAPRNYICFYAFCGSFVCIRLHLIGNWPRTHLKWGVLLRTPVLSFYSNHLVIKSVMIRTEFNRICIGIVVALSNDNPKQNRYIWKCCSRSNDRSINGI